MPIIINFLLSLVTNKWFWIVIGVIILGLIARNKWDDLSRWFQPGDIDVEPGGASSTKDIPDSRKVELKALANLLYADIYDTPFWGGHTISLYEEANDLPDIQLKYLSEYYRKKLTRGNWLEEDIDGELFTTSDINTRLMAHLAKIGQKG